MYVRIEQSEAEKLALVLDSVEADLVGLQHRVFRVREALQRKAGKPCGFQYEDDRRAVHHIDGDPTNNAPENLRVMNPKDRG